MYAFPYPQTSRIEPLKVPILSDLGRPIGFEELSALLNQICVNPKLVPVGIENVISSSLQACLFFDIASEALGRPLAHHEFADESHGDDTLATIDLRIPKWFWLEFYQRWSGLREELPNNEFQRMRQRLEDAFNSACSLMAGFDHLEADLGDDLALILLSVHMLLRIISSILNFGICPALPNLKSTKLLVHRAIGNGWCPKRLNILNAVELSHYGLYYLSSVSPPGSQSHLGCSAQACLISTTLLPPTHRSPECLCQDVGISVSQANQVIAAGGVPLVRMSRTSSGNLNLDIVPYSWNCSFVAISHVWADRQLGSTRNALPRCQLQHLYSMMTDLPRHTILWRFRDWIRGKTLPPGVIESPNHSYELFWLDSFCIPQAPEHASLRNKAIESMNFIYAVASETLVVDAGLQHFDAGRRSSSQYDRGRATFFAPEEGNMLDTLAQICASNWMGRAWTLQEGSLSDDCVLPLRGSLAYLRLLYPRNISLRSGFERALMACWTRQMNWRRRRDDTNLDRFKENVLQDVPYYVEACWDLCLFLSCSLQQPGRYEYARGKVAHKSKLVSAYSLLQSRSTSQINDLPLILVNLSGFNGNYLSKVKSAEERMRLLMYGLGDVPLDLLFFQCRRIGGPKTIDRWIPREVAPGRFLGEHTLRLVKDGFKLQLEEGVGGLRLFILPRFYPRYHDFVVSCPDSTGLYRTDYLARALSSGNGQAEPDSDIGWCVLIDYQLELRGARFVIVEMDQKTVFLRYDCPLQLTEVEYNSLSATERSEIGPLCHATKVEAEWTVLIERSDTPQVLATSRPQNPVQYSDRWLFIANIVTILIQCAEIYPTEHIIKKYGNDTPLILAGMVFYLVQALLVQRGVNLMLHYSWTATYQPSWDPEGPWKWFWKVMNFEPGPTLKTIHKLSVWFLFIVSIYTKNAALGGYIIMYSVQSFKLSELIIPMALPLLTQAVMRHYFP